MFLAAVKPNMQCGTNLQTPRSDSLAAILKGAAGWEMTALRPNAERDDVHSQQAST